MIDADLFGPIEPEAPPAGLVTSCNVVRVELHKLNEVVKKRVCEGCGQHMHLPMVHVAEFYIGKGHSWQLFLCERCADDMVREIERAEPEVEE